MVKNKETKLNKYGDENYNNREKSFITSMEIYGYTSPMKNNKVKEKSKNVKKEKYNNENYNNTNKIKEFWNNVDNDYIKSFVIKTKESKLRIYGNENYNNSDQNG